MAEFAFFDAPPERDTGGGGDTRSESTGQLPTPEGSEVIAETEPAPPTSGFVPNPAPHGGDGCPRSEPTPAPADKPPLYVVQNPGAIHDRFCFACEYCDAGKRKKRAGLIGASELANAYDDIIALIQDSMLREETSRVCEVVWKFYEQHIRPFYNLPEWSRTAIWEHIMTHTQNDDWITNDSVSMLTSTVESLRSRAWNKVQTPDGQVSMEPNVKNTNLMLKCIQAREQLLTSKRRRMAGS